MKTKTDDINGSYLGKFTKFNVLDDIYDAFSDLYFHIALCFILRYIVQCSIMVNKFAVKVQRPGLKKLYSSSYLGQCQKVLVIYTFGDIYKW